MSLCPILDRELQLTGQGRALWVGPPAEHPLCGWYDYVSSLYLYRAEYEHIY